MKLIFIRHAETVKNAEGLMHKTGDSALLTSLGKSQMNKVSKLLKKEKVSILYCSPEARAKESAVVLNKFLKVKIIVLGELAERKWGEWEKRSWPEIQEDLKNMPLEERYNFIPPKGESWKQMEERLKKALKIIEENRGNPGIVTHMGALRGLMPILLEEGKEAGIKYEFDNASISIFEHFKNHYKKIKINDVRHLS